MLFSYLVLGKLHVIVFSQHISLTWHYILKFLLPDKLDKLGKLFFLNFSSNMIPVNDNVWHHLGYVWNNANGRWDVLIDGTPRAIRTSVKVGKVIPAGGTLVIGQRHATTDFQVGKGFLGQLSGVNIWDQALTGEEVEAMAQYRGNEEGNVLRWFSVLKNIVGNIQVVKPSNAQNTSKCSY